MTNTNYDNFNPESLIIVATEDESLAHDLLQDIHFAFGPGATLQQHNSVYRLVAAPVISEHLMGYIQGFAMGWLTRRKRECAR